MEEPIPVVGQVTAPALVVTSKMAAVSGQCSSEVGKSEEGWEEVGDTEVMASTHRR